MSRDAIHSGYYPGSPNDDLPHYVYTFWAGSTPVYVGCTNNLQRRMREHQQAGWLMGGVTWIAWTVYSDREAGLRAESQRIAKLMPRRNIRHNPGAMSVSHAYAVWEAHLAWEAEFEAYMARVQRHAS